MANTDFQNGVVLGSVAGGNIQTSAPSGNIEITENGEYDVASYATATVNVATGGSGSTITQNFIQMLFAANFGAQPSMKSIDGNIYSTSGLGSALQPYLYRGTTAKYADNNHSEGTLMVGTGTSPTTKETYKLDNPISYYEIQSYSLTQVTTPYPDAEYALTQTWKYNGSDTLTITEVGLTCRFNCGGTSRTFMFARKVLDNPIVVNSGDTFTVSVPYIF